jgi:hypothetical protein
MGLTEAQQNQLYEDEIQDTFTRSDVSKLSQKTTGRETDISTTQSINIENSEKVSKETKKDLKKTEETNNENVQEAKPKLIIKIPKPFALGYWIIDLSKLLGKLLAGILAAVSALLLALIAGLLAALLQKIFDKLGKVSQNDIDKSLNGMDMNSLLNQAQSDYDKSLLSNDSMIDINKGDGKVTDLYSKGHTNRKNIANKNKYTINKRNRKDILDSNAVKERDSSNNKNTKFVNNPNYGIYLD